MMSSRLGAMGEAGVNVIHFGAVIYQEIEALPFQLNGLLLCEGQCCD
jgi:hypothetical protein